MLTAFGQIIYFRIIFLLKEYFCILNYMPFTILAQIYILKCLFRYNYCSSYQLITMSAGIYLKIFLVLVIANSHSFTASDGSEESIADRVASHCSIMVHHGFRSEEARHARKQKYQLRQTTSHSSLLVAHQGDVSRKFNQAFLFVDSFNFNFVDEERSDIYC